MEREAALKHSFGEVEAKNEVVAALEKQVKELEQKLQLADTKSQQKVCFILNSVSMAALLYAHAHVYTHIYMYWGKDFSDHLVKCPQTINDVNLHVQRSRLIHMFEISS